MPELILPELILQESDGGRPAFAGPTGDLVYFLSFAVAERYGSMHDLSAAAQLLRTGNSINLRPLLTFAEDRPAGAAGGNMESFWQEAAPVAAAARAVSAAIPASDRLRTLTHDFPALLPGLKELATLAEAAAQRGVRLRLLFRLEGPRRPLPDGS